LIGRRKAAPDRVDRWVVARPVAQFALTGLAALVIVGVATLVASRRVGEREAVTDARTTTLARAQGLVEPAVTDSLPSGDPAAVARVAEVVERDVVDESLVRVKIWTGDGKIVYSDEPRLEGQSFPLADDELAALHGGLIEADVSDLTNPENIYERDFGKLLQVYLPIRTPSGERLLFEAYYRYDVVSASGWRIWRSFAPIALGALVVLELLQIPLAWSLARQLRQRQAEREELLRRTLEASDVERRRIASDLHDGVVQDLAGVSFALAGAARNESTSAEASGLLDSSAGLIRASITDLRSLLVDIYPHDLEGGGLEPALSDLVTGIATDELVPSLDASGLVHPVSTDIATLLYRATREGLRNVVQHAGARNVQVSVGADAEHAWLSVVDDGVGFDPEAAEARVADGHFGLRGLDGLVNDAGGVLIVEAGPTRGTVMFLEVPIA
jgi:two-component system NarL family sensor kinase